MNETEIIKRLKELLEKAVKDCCRAEKVGIVFSAGIDSSVIATLAKNFSKITAYAVGNENSKDVEYVKKLRDQIDFKIKVTEIDIKDVRENLPKILRIIEKKDPLQISCAIPVYFASREGRMDGLKIMLSGQGGDELFGGYNRYLQHTDDYEKLKKILEKDMRSAYEDNLNRDMAICAANDIELKFPFMNKKLVNFTLKIPTQLKIKEVKMNEFSCWDEVNGKKFIRKYILRKVAQEIEVPRIILNRSKKALQYGSGSWKILQRIAKEEGFKEKVEGKNYVKLYLESLNLE